MPLLEKSFQVVCQIGNGCIVADIVVVHPLFRNSAEVLLGLPIL